MNMLMLECKFVPSSLLPYLCLNVPFSLFDTVELGSLRWATLLMSLELLVRVRMRTLLRLLLLAPVVKLHQFLCEARMINE